MVTLSLRKPNARRIGNIFPLCMKSNVLEKSTNDSVASRCSARTPLMF